MNERIVLGAMSGTSADGVDVAAVEVSGRGLGMAAEYLHHVERPYDADLRRRIFAVRESGAARLDELAGLGRNITLAYAAATRNLLKELSLPASKISAVAAHGQTLYHAPPNTIQWLDPSLLAAETGLAVVSDFRRADCAAGGQGAPLVPFADWILFRHPTKTRVILNLGGIANLTYLPAGGGIEDVIAFDTGPGCCLSDWAVRRYFPELPGYDVDGRIGSNAGIVGDPEAFLRHPYFRKGPPKSTDVPEMVRAFDECLQSVFRQPDFEAREGVVGTATWLAARCFWDAVPMTGDWPDEVIVAGGGTRNAALMSRLNDKQRRLTATIWTLDEFGLPSQAREAVCFAILGAATLDGEPSNVPNATGAKRRIVLGSVTPRPTPAGSPDQEFQQQADQGDCGEDDDDQAVAPVAAQDAQEAAGEAERG